MKKIIALCLAAFMMMSFVACADKGNVDVSSNIEGVMPEIDPEGTFPPELLRDLPDVEDELVDETEFDEYEQETTSAPATIRLYADGSFVMTAVMYDGLPEISGSFTDDGDEFVLKPVETSAANIDLADIGEIKLEKQGMNLVYHGVDIGETLEGVVFEPKF